MYASQEVIRLPRSPGCDNKDFSELPGVKETAYNNGKSSETLKSDNIALNAACFLFYFTPQEIIYQYKQLIYWTYYWLYSG